MGNDGGSIPKRIELVKEKQKEVRPDQNALKIATWFFCALSKRLLQEPVVVCGLGKLYNKDAVIEYLLNKNVYGDGDTICSHISTMKDVKALKLAANPAFKDTNGASIAHFDQGMVSRFICPITMKEMNGKVKFVYLETCGCVFSEQGLKEVPSSSCIQCSKPFKQENIITINPSHAEQEQQESAEDNVIAESSSSASRNKRKREGNSEQSILKKPAIELEVGVTASSSGHSGIGGNSVTAVVNQKVQEHLVNTSSKNKQSKAIQSIYSQKKDKRVTESYLVRAQIEHKHQFKSILKMSREAETPPPLFRSGPGSSGTSKTFSFLAPHYKDFINDDETFGEGDSFFGSAKRLTSPMIGRQTLYTPSRKVSFTSILDKVSPIKFNGQFGPSRDVIIEKLTTKSPLREQKKINFLENITNVKFGADKSVKNRVNAPQAKKKVVNKTINITTAAARAKKVTIPKEFNFSKRFDKPQVKKIHSQGIQKRQPFKKPGKDLKVPPKGLKISKCLDKPHARRNYPMNKSQRVRQPVKKSGTDSTVTIPKEFNFSKRLDKPRRTNVKNFPTRKTNGIQKRRPVKTILTIPKPFRFHVGNRSKVVNDHSPKSPFISLAEQVQHFTNKTPDRFKSKTVTMKLRANKQT
ncbi:13278_t:CDS:10 [Funneliformis geosporum]|nr:13278_t:CDS:10 [Funneliformis geosporum]